jgi:hypothetical protein
MARYFLQVSHTADECLQTLDEVLAQGPEVLATYDFGCAAGDHSNHVCYATIEATNGGAAREFVPAMFRERAQIVEVGKVTPEQIRSYHAS